MGLLAGPVMPTRIIFLASGLDASFVFAGH